MANRTRADEFITNVHIAVYATASLGGAENKIHSERIAARCFELDPLKFSWRLKEYRKWPDKYVVKTALEDAKKEEHNYLVDGAYNLDPAKDGWRLTHNGAVWFRGNRDRLEQHFGIEPPSKAALQKDQIRILGELRKQPLYRQFNSTRNLSGVSQYVFTDMLNCSPDATSEVIGLKFRRLRASAELAGKREVLDFLDACQEQFAASMPGWDKREKN